MRSVCSAGTAVDRLGGSKLSYSAQWAPVDALTGAWEYLAAEIPLLHPICESDLNVGGWEFSEVNGHDGGHFVINVMMVRCLSLGVSTLGYYNRY